MNITDDYLVKVASYVPTDAFLFSLSLFQSVPSLRFWCTVSKQGVTAGALCKFVFSAGAIEMSAVSARNWQPSSINHRMGQIGQQGCVCVWVKDQTEPAAVQLQQQWNSRGGMLTAESLHSLFSVEMLPNSLSPAVSSMSLWVRVFMCVCAFF